jgi:hypothetical protein
MKVKFLTLLAVSFILIYSSCSKESLNGSTSYLEIKDAKEAQTKLLTLLKEKKINSKIDLEVKRMEAEEKIKGHGALSKRNAVDKYASLAHNHEYMFYRNLIKRAINPDDYECGPTILDEYLGPIISAWTPEEAGLFFQFGFLAFDEAYYLDNTEGEDYFGENGEYTQQIKRYDSNLRRFWNIREPILLGDAHSNIYKDVPLLAKLLQLTQVEGEGDDAHPISAETAMEIAQLIHVVFGTDAFENYNHPLFTFNAFAAGDPENGIPMKTVMGDGIMRAYKELGFEDVANHFIMAHEYGHHIQVFIDYIPITYQYFDPEETRKLELMADAYAAYYSAHKQGANMRGNKLAKAQDAAYSVGDCFYEDPGHHGTPNQRKLAASFGILIATDEYRKNEIISMKQFYRIFNALYHHIIKPDGFVNKSDINF